MTDLAAVAPLLLVAGVFVGVCIIALRATDWKLRDDRRPSAATSRHAAGAHARREPEAADDVPAGTEAVPEDHSGAEREPVGTAAVSGPGTGGVDEAAGPDGADDDRASADPGDADLPPGSGDHGRHRAGPGA